MLWIHLCSFNQESLLQGIGIPGLFAYSPFSLDHDKNCQTGEKLFLQDLAKKVKNRQWLRFFTNSRHLRLVLLDDKTGMAKHSLSPISASGFLADKTLDGFGDQEWPFWFVARHWFPILNDLKDDGLLEVVSVSPAQAQHSLPTNNGKQLFPFFLFLFLFFPHLTFQCRHQCFH